MTFLALLCTLLGLSTAVTGFSLRGFFNADDSPCLSSRCLQSAAFILQTMDNRSNPCDDFFTYTCGNYYKENPIPDSQIMNDLNRRKEREYELKAKAMLLGEAQESDPESVTKARTLFRSCTNTGYIEEVGFLPIIDALATAGLSLIPSINNDSFDWLSTNVVFQKKTGQDILLQFTILSDDQNKTIKRLGLGVPGDWTMVTQSNRQQGKRSIFTPHPIHMAADSTSEENENHTTVDSDTIQDELDFGKQVLITIMSEVEHNLTKTAIKKTMSILKDAIQIDRSIEVLQTRYSNSENSTKYSLKDLQKILDDVEGPGKKSSLNLTRFFTEIFMDVENVTLHLTDDTPIVVNNLRYLQKLLKYINKISPRKLAVMFWWRVVKALTPLSTHNMRELYQEFKTAEYGFEYDVKSRALLCTQLTMQAFPFAIGYKIMDRTYLERINPGIQEMFSNFRLAFASNIRSYKWIDSPTKEMMIDKLNGIKLLVGYPDWMFDKEAVDLVFSEISVCEEHFAQNLIDYSSAIFMSTLSSFNETSDPDEEANAEWGSFNIFTSNAFYFPEDNSMTILLPQLEYPFYDLGLEALNYGALGSVIGHELSHAFDNSGRTYDRYGNRVAKWSDTSINNYVNKTECLVDQYDSYYIPEVDQHVDGKKTLNENIADNSGLRLALAAYRMWVQTHGKERSLPGLESFNHEQLLFLSYAGVDCHSVSDTALLNMLANEHSPTEVRINLTLTNLPDFFTAWKCKIPNSGSNRRCRLL